MHQETVPSRASDDKDDWPCGRHVRSVDGDVHVWDVANLGHKQPRHQLRLEPSTWLAQDRLSGNQLPDSLSCASLALRAVRRSTSNCRLGVGMGSAWVYASCSSELPCRCDARADRRSKKAWDIVEDRRLERKFGPAAGPSPLTYP